MDNKHIIDILLFEDNPNDVKLTLRALRQNNIANNVQVVSDGEEALDFIFRRGSYANRSAIDRPKLILLDLKLPKISGLEVLRALKNDEISRTIPIVVLTSSKEDKDVAECYKHGVNSYVVKPLDFDQFISSVSKLGLYWLLINEPLP